MPRPSEPAWVMPAKGAIIKPDRATASASVASRVWPPAVVLAAIGVVWELGVRASNAAPSVLPRPSQVARATWQERHALFVDAWITGREALLGLALATAVAVVIAIVLDRSGPLRRGIEPLLVGSQVLPIVAIAPLFIIWFDFGLLGKVLTVALFTFFPIVVGLGRGLRATDPDAEALMQTMGGTRRDVLWRVRVPSALPSTFTGLRLAATYAVVAAVISEFLGAFDGLGITMQEARGSYQTDLLFASVAATFLLTMGLIAVVAAAERLVIPWARQPR